MIEFHHERRPLQLAVETLTSVLGDQLEFVRQSSSSIPFGDPIGSISITKPGLGVVIGVCLIHRLLTRLTPRVVTARVPTSPVELIKRFGFPASCAGTFIHRHVITSLRGFRASDPRTPR